MIRVFIINTGTKEAPAYICLNTDNDADATKLIHDGAKEVPADKVKTIFGEKAAYASPLTVKVNAAGEIVSFTPPAAKSLKELKAEKRAELKAIKRSFDNQLINDKMILTSSLGFIINADLRSQNNIRGLIECGADKVEYRDAENNGHVVTAEELRIMLVECIQNGEYLYAQAWMYEHDIEQAETAEELAKIELDFSMLDFSQNID